MSTSAQAVLQEVRRLPAAEQLEISREIQRWLKPNRTAATDIDPIRSARGLLAGAGLTAALLASRAEEARRG